MTTYETKARAIVAEFVEEAQYPVADADRRDLEAAITEALRDAAEGE